MSSSESNFIEDMVARQTVKDYGTFRALCRESPFVTPPPPDLETVIEELRGQEEEARKALHDDGCPPCYPPDLDFPLQNIPREYKGVVSYWKSLPAVEYAVLSAQLSDWRRFRQFQKRIRRYYLPRGTFNDFQAKVRDRRRRRGLEGDMCLHLDLEKHTQLEDWIEFQDYHITIHEQLEKAAQDMETSNSAQEIWAPSVSEDEGTEESEISGERPKGRESRLMYHEFLLQWIERQRKRMAAERASSVDDTRNHDDNANGPKDTRRSPTLDRQKRRSKAHSLLSPVQAGVSKRKPQRRSLRLQKCDVSREAESKAANSSTTQRSISRMPDRHKSSLRRKESTALRPQRVSKIAKIESRCKQPIGIDVKSQPISRHLKGGQRKFKQQARSSGPKYTQQSTSTMVKTRSGRESKRLERFCPN